MIKKRVVYVQGTWDLFHVGHLNILKRAEELACKLIVGVNTDESVKEYKGCLPIISFRDRVEIIKACRFVDETFQSDLTFDPDLLKEYKVEVIVVGSDWKDKKVVGQDEAVAEGIEFIYVPYTRRVSSTEIKKRIREEG